MNVIPAASSDVTMGPPAAVPHPEHIERAVRWLVGTPRADWPSPIVPTLQREFGLTAREACATLREFNLAMTRAR